MRRIVGDIIGLKSNQVRRIEALYRRRLAPEALCTPELANELALLSTEIRRQLGLLVDRRGRIVTVMVGDGQKIVIPDLDDFRAAPGRLRGVRCLHTHLKGEPLSRDDLTDLALLRLDLMAAMTLRAAGPRPPGMWPTSCRRQKVPPITCWRRFRPIIPKSTVWAWCGPSKRRWPGSLRGGWPNGPASGPCW
jgi:hypothetical protein